MRQMQSSSVTSTSSRLFVPLRLTRRGMGATPPVSLSDRAYGAIREEILRGQLRPGTPLSRRRLAQELGMSVLPVTDALRRLEVDGLVESRARAGTRVRVPSDADIHALYELREALETQSARLFARKATPAERLELKVLAGQVDAMFNRLPTSDDPDLSFKVHSQHVRLHMFIAQHARSRLLGEMIERNHVLILNWLFDVGARRTPLPPDFHTRLANAIVSGDPHAADAAMRAHVQYGLSEIAGNFDALTASEGRERKRSVAANGSHRSTRARKRKS
jgi:GntR family transcriptional regulator, rspAB operon transcriptional repressor